MSDNGYGYGSAQQSNSGMQQKDAFHHWNKEGAWDKNNSERETKKYPIWSQLQMLEDRLHNIYSEGTDFAATMMSTVTEAEFRMLPFRMMWSVGWYLMFFYMMWLWTIIGSFFELSPPILYGGVVAIAAPGILFPQYILQQARQWVSGELRTGRFYKHMSGAWSSANATIYLSAIVFLLIPYGFSYEFISEWAMNYEGKGEAFINTITTDSVTYSLRKASYIMAGFTGFLFLYTMSLKKKAKKLQIERTREMKEAFFGAGDIAEEMLSGKS